MKTIRWYFTFDDFDFSSIS